MNSIETEYIDIVFDGPPGPEAGPFVEVENDRGEKYRAWNVDTAKRRMLGAANTNGLPRTGRDEEGVAWLNVTAPGGTLPAVAPG